MPTEIDSAIAAGAGFLSARRSRDGMWRDFHTMAGASADWVTAFVCEMTRGCDELQPDVAGATAALAGRQRDNGGWGYNHAVPTDCDSTAWALLALSGPESRHPSAIDTGRAYLRAHQVWPEGGFATYAKTDGIDRFIGAHDSEAISGWLAPHACVTSVALRALIEHGEPRESREVSRAREYVMRACNESGAWTSYWWPGTAYNTFFALRALAAFDAFDETTVGVLRLDRDAGAFDTALAVLTLLLVHRRADVCASEALLERLLSSQQRDGGWPSRPILRIPAPTQVSPDSHADWRTDGLRGSGVILADPRRVFTSTAAVSALARYRAVRRAEP